MKDFLLLLFLCGLMFGFGYFVGRDSRGGVTTPPAAAARVRVVSPATAVRTAAAPRPVVPPTPGSARSTIMVRPEPTTLWRERGWTARRNTLYGYYRTPWGAFRGRIEGYRGRFPTFYIQQPPKGLSTHRHAACFQSRRNRWYFVHFAPKPRDPDSGIRKIEQILHEILDPRRRS